MSGQQELVQRLKEAAPGQQQPRLKKRFKADTRSKEGVWFGNLAIPWNFTGRTLELQKLHETVLNSHAVGSIALILSGLGGIGKTTLAQKYAFDYKDAFEGNVIWLPGDDADMLEKDYRRLGKDSLNIAEAENLKLQLLIREVYFSFKNKKCLFIFDNVVDSSILKPFLQNNVLVYAQRPFFLIISRNINLFGTENTFILDVLKKNEAIQLIQKSLPSSKALERERLAEKLGYLPLALQQALAYIRHPSGLNSIEDYLKDYDENAKKAFCNKKVGSMNNYEQATFITFKITMKKILEECGKDAGLANYLLTCTAYSAPDSIFPLALYSYSSSDDNRKVEFCIKIFAAYSIIFQRAGKGAPADDSMFMHRLVQHLIRLSNENEIKFLRQVIISQLQRVRQPDTAGNDKLLFRSELIRDAIIQHEQLYVEFPDYFYWFAISFSAEQVKHVITKFKDIWGESSVFTVKLVLKHYLSSGELEELFEPISKMLDLTNKELNGHTLVQALKVGMEYVSRVYIALPYSTLEICDKIISVLQALDKNNTSVLIHILELKCNILNSIGRVAEKIDCRFYLSNVIKYKKEQSVKDEALIKSFALFGVSNESQERGREFMLNNLEGAVVQSILKEVRTIQEKIVPNLPHMVLKVHLGVECFFCQKLPILYRRYKCQECLNLHFCEECYQSRYLYHFEGQHKFQEVDADFGILLNQKPVIRSNSSYTGL